ncbi:MAG: C39 family peptidase [Candidatus Acetothermia bacterium]
MLKASPKIELRSPFTRYLLAFLVVIATIIANNWSATAWPVDSYEELRYENVRKQNTFSSCGPASLATLFSEFYGKEISEEEIAEKTKPYLDEEIEKPEEGEIPEGGVSMLDLKKVSRELGFPTRGYEIPEENLMGIMEKLKTPLIVYLERPEEHFVLTVGGHRGKVILADPTLGIRAVGQNNLFEKWDGLILAFSPDKEYRDQAQTVISEIEKRAGKRNRTQSFAREFLWDIRN